MEITVIPKYAKIIKGSWKKDDGYGDVWCKINKIDIQHNELSLNHPRFGEFAWVSISDCVFTDTISKNDLNLFNKDGFYVYHKNKLIKYDKKLQVVEDYIKSIIGEWSIKTADKWSEYLFVEYKNGFNIDEFTF